MSVVSSRRLVVAAVSSAALAASMLTTAASGALPASGALALPLGVGHPTLASTGAAAPTDAQCRAALGTPCYSPQEIRRAYGVDTLTDAGFTGKGQTIVIVDSFGSPTIAGDLATFDADYGLPAPPSFTVRAPLGTVPFDPTNSDMVGWAFETTLDVEWAHAMAPDASIVLLTSPVSETEGVQGLPQFLALERYALDRHLGQIISQSWGATEQTLTGRAGRQVVASFEALYARAAAQHVTVLASSGDSGVANLNTDQSANFPFPTVIFPASSPLVTAVGGTSLYATTSGRYQSETVWNNSTGATGGGLSALFTEPGYQYVLPRSDQKLLDGHRGLPDVAWNADPDTAILVYTSFIPGGVGYYFIGGTSEGSPQWAGLIADANQLAHRPLGYLNPGLYALGATAGHRAPFHDITVGDNSFAGITGFNATKGWDATTGWGTPNLGELAWSLAQMH